MLLEIATQIAPRKMSDILGLMQPDAAERLTVELARRAGSDKSAAAAESAQNRRQDDAAKAQLTRIFNKTLSRPILRFKGAGEARFAAMESFEAKRLPGMGRTAAAGFGRWAAHWRGRPGVASAVALAAFARSGCSPAWLIAASCRADDPVKGEATFSAVRRLCPADAEARRGCRVRSHHRRLDHRDPLQAPGGYSVDKLSDAVPDYVGSARRDPDGSAIRLSLSRRVTINTMTAGERIFVDFLPDSWTGPPPLAAGRSHSRTGRAGARRRARASRRSAPTREAKKKPPVRVRASVQPTFVRFVFEMPDGVNVSSVLNDQKLTLQFNSVLTFDLADAKVAAPPNIASITQRTDVDSSAVDIMLIGEVDVHSFREEKNYVIDVAFQQVEKPRRCRRCTRRRIACPAQPRRRAVAPAAAAVPQLPRCASPLSESMPPQQPARSCRRSPRRRSPRRPRSRSSPAASAERRRRRRAPQPSTKQPLPKDSAGREDRTKNEAAEPSAEPRRRSRDGRKDAGRAEQAAKPAARAKRAAGRSPKAARQGSGRSSRGRSRPIAGFRRGEAGQRRPARDVLVCRADAGGHCSAAPTPCGWCSTRTGRSISKRSAPRAARSSATSAGCRWKKARRSAFVSTARRCRRWKAMAAPAARLDADLRRPVQAPPLPLMVLRNITDPALANVSVPLANPGLLHRLVDPDAGDTLLVVTAPPPTRGFIKRQDFVELSLLESDPRRRDPSEFRRCHRRGRIRQGDARQAGRADVVIGRRRRRTRQRRGAAAVRRPEWRKNQEENSSRALDALIKATAAAEPEQRTQARLDLANFYMARGMFHGSPRRDQPRCSPRPSRAARMPTVMMVHAVASILIGHPERGLKDLANPAIGNGYDSQLWKALAFARQGKWADAREKFKNAEFAIARCRWICSAS